MENEPEEIVEDAQVFAEEETQETINRPNPVLLVPIMTTVKQLQKESEDDPIEDIVFLTTIEYIKGTSRIKGSDNLSHTVFSYYLEVYRGINLINQKEENDEVILHPDAQPLLYTKAALSLFDVYSRYPDKHLARRMVDLSATALHQIVAVHQSSVEDRPMKEALSDLSSVAMLCHTAKDYVKGKKRKYNYDYIAWLKDFLERATSTNDLSFMREDLTIKKVLKQISSGSRIIEL